MKKTSPPRLVRRFFAFAAIGVLVAVLTACTGRGGGYLPPADPVFTGPASFGFEFRCERSSRSTSPNPPTGRLRIELAYTDHGSNPIGSWFSIHGIVDTLDPVLQSQICIAQEPPPPGEFGNELIFLGRYRLTAGGPAMFPTTCPTRDTPTSPLCRFEVIVRDNDQDFEPSPGDYFSIRLSSATAVTSELPLVFYARAGFLEAGNITVN